MYLLWCSLGLLWFCSHPVLNGSVWLIRIDTSALAGSRCVSQSLLTHVDMHRVVWWPGKPYYCLPMLHTWDWRHSSGVRANNAWPHKDLLHWGKNVVKPRYISGKWSGWLCQVKQYADIVLSASRCCGTAGSIAHCMNCFTVCLIQGKEEGTSCFSLQCYLCARRTIRTCRDYPCTFFCCKTAVD